MLTHYITKSGLIVESDGFIIIVNKGDIQEALNHHLREELAKLPSEKKYKETSYFFNASMDRECCTEYDEKFAFNPSKFYDIFGALTQLIPDTSWKVGNVFYNVLEIESRCVIVLSNDGVKPAASFGANMDEGLKWVEALSKASTPSDLLEVAKLSCKKAVKIYNQQ